MLSVAKIQRRNAWRYYIRGVAFGDGRRPVGQSLKDAQERAGLPPGRWLGRGLRALGLTAAAEVSERQLELLFGEGRHPDADRIERGLLDDGVDGLREGRGHHEGDRRLGTPWLRAPAAVGSRARVRPEQGTHRER
ncbi:relaxase domain-containing protein [Streptomyces griseofuscus]|uniref:relaxase domain-containing protein n=1 Tax=Streptomyces griseofuscus TaxID=146922 RepID=UPI003F5182F9